MENFTTSQRFSTIGFRKRFFQFREDDAVTNKTTTSRPLNSESGFVLVLILAILPIIIFAILSILSTMWFVREKEKMQMLCEKHILIAQQILIDGAYDLKDLNPQVDDLVMRKEQLEWELSVAQGPEKMGIAAQLVLVRGQMVLLRMRQRLTIRQTEARAFAELQKMELAARQQVRKITQAWEKGSLNTRLRFRRPRMQVDPHYEDFSLPTYDFGVGYQSRQRIDVNISVQGASPFPKWFTKLLGRNRMSWKEKCTSQPKQEEGQTWRSYLSGARLF